MKDCQHYKNCTICCCESKPSLFKNLNEKEFAELHSERKEIFFKSGEVIFKQGTALTHIACFRKGFAKVYHERSEGSNIMVNIVGPGHLCGSMGLFNDNTHHLTTQALTNVEVCLISVANLDSLLNASKNMAIELIRSKNKSLVDITNKLANLTYKNVHERVADVLLYLSKEIYKADAFKLDLSRQDLADLAAMTKESFIRTLKEMKDAGYIRQKGKFIELLQPDKLKELS